MAELNGRSNSASGGERGQLNDNQLSFFSLIEIDAFDRNTLLSQEMVLI